MIAVEEVEAPDLTFDLMVADELDKHPPCESGNHVKAVFGHEPGESAAFLCIAPCGMIWACCEGWAKSQVLYRNTACDSRVLGPGACDGTHPTSAYVFIPLNNTKEGTR